MKNEIIVLIVDDEEVIRDLLGVIVSMWKHTTTNGINWSVQEVYYAENVPHARTVIAGMATKPDLLITDRSMGTPEAGEVLIREVAQWETPPKVVFQSGDPVKTISSVMGSIAQDYPELRIIYLPKPYRPDELKQALVDLFDE